jgi:hypothetical protein
VTETVPAGYHADGATTKAVLVNNNAKCSDSRTWARRWRSATRR